MIYTLTLNPALDLELQIEQFAFNSVARASHSQRDCGGKGLNVSRMLRHLNVDSIAMGFVGGYNGQRLQSDLTALGVQTLFTPIAAETRTNVSIVATGSSQHIKVNEAGPVVSVTEWDQLISTIKQYLTPGDWWVLAGSLPQGVPDMAYADLITLIEGAGAYVILDASGAAFYHGCLAKPSLIKPNLEEAHQLMALTPELSGKWSLTQMMQSQDWVRDLLNIGPKQLVVSLGSEGAFLATPQQWAQFASPKIVEANPIGAGDSMVAGLVWRLSLGDSLAQALPYGLACGAATACLPGTQLGSLAQVKRLLSVN